MGTFRNACLLVAMVAMFALQNWLFGLLDIQRTAGLYGSWDAWTILLIGVGLVIWSGGALMLFASVKLFFSKIGRSFDFVCAPVIVGVVAGCGAACFSAESAGILGGILFGLLFFSAGAMIMLLLQHLIESVASFFYSLKK